MKLRPLKPKDAGRMLEWMKDDDLSNFFRFDSKSSSLDTTLQFIVNAQDSTVNLHMAVVNDDDCYMGTVSLKDIDRINHNAEYAISLHKDARGVGYAAFATDEILKFAFNQLKLHRVYLDVFSDNLRAVRFYEKYGFEYEGESKECCFVNGQYRSLKWFSILNISR